MYFVRALTMLALGLIPAAGFSAPPFDLHNAAREGGAELASVLLDGGADINGTDDLGRTPLLYAAEHGHDRVVELLLQEGADTEATWEGWTPLSASAGNGHKDVVERLLSSGVRINLQGKVDNKDELYVAPLFVASQNGHADVVETLLSAGAEVNVTLGSGNSALHTAAFHGHHEIVEILISAGAAVDGVIDRGKYHGTTPLHYAALFGDHDSLEILLKSGADPNARNAVGHSPLNYASCFGKRSFHDKLTAHGAVLAPDIGSGTEDECLAVLDDYPKWALHFEKPVMPWMMLTMEGDFCDEMFQWYPRVVYCDDFGN